MSRGTNRVAIHAFKIKNSQGNIITLERWKAYSAVLWADAATLYKAYVAYPGAHWHSSKIFSQADSKRQLDISYLYPPDLGKYIRSISYSR